MTGFQLPLFKSCCRGGVTLHALRHTVAVQIVFLRRQLL